MLFGLALGQQRPALEHVDGIRVPPNLDARSGASERGGGDLPSHDSQRQRAQGEGPMAKPPEEPAPQKLGGQALVIQGRASDREEPGPKLGLAGDVERAPWRPGLEHRVEQAAGCLLVKGAGLLGATERARVPAGGEVGGVQRPRLEHSRAELGAKGFGLEVPRVEPHRLDSPRVWGPQVLVLLELEPYRQPIGDDPLGQLAWGERPEDRREEQGERPLVEPVPMDHLDRPLVVSSAPNDNLELVILAHRVEDPELMPIGLA